MQDAAKKLLLEILHIINYSDNKEKFVNEFEAYNHLDAMKTLVDRLPSEVKQQIRFVQEDVSLMRQYISHEEYIKEFEIVTLRELKKFIEVISPVLTLAQKQRIASLME